jgi:GH15 family glucan-1,4-alpha-glucosidase
MALRIEDYALIGDTHSAGLVGYDGSIDWLCLPRFDSGACFAALLGGPENGRWVLRPSGGSRTVSRRYRGDTLVLETEFANDEGTVRVVDCMPMDGEPSDVVRLVEGVDGRVEMESSLLVRYDYGHVVPWIRHEDNRLLLVAGPDGLVLDGPVQHSENETGLLTARFAVDAGESCGFRLASFGRRLKSPPRDIAKLVAQTEQYWNDWSGQATYAGEYREAVMRSLLTLKALSYRPSGGIVAAATTSLPEKLGGVRNWDYRYCWIRDATFTLLALLAGGYSEDASAWREWLLRAVAGQPEQMQIMYGVLGERRLTEIEIPWLAGYANSKPVRVGNAAHEQFQLDVYGELMDALYQARAHGIPPDDEAWKVQTALMDFLESHWRDADDGIWEIRGQRRDFVYSKVMAWTAADRAVKAVEQFSLDGPADQWRKLRQEIFDEVCECGYDSHRNTFTQYYGSKELDAALLLIAPVGFLPPSDKRVQGTVAAIERELMNEGFVQRYTMTGSSVDGLPPGEGAFLACTFWLADNYILQGELDKGRQTFERLLALRNDVGLLSEEYDPEAKRLVGNIPQAFSHVPLINTAINLADRGGPVHRRSSSGTHGAGDAGKGGSRAGATSGHRAGGGGGDGGGGGGRGRGGGGGGKAKPPAAETHKTRNETAQSRKGR